MKQLQRFWVPLATAGIAGTSALAHAALSKPAESRTTFRASGPAGLTIEGETSDLQVTESNGDFVITVPLGNLHTGIDVRDRHMREKYLEVDKYRDAQLTFAKSALKVPAAGEKAAGDTSASITLHGQTHPVTVHYEVKGGDGGSVAADGKFHINMKDFGIVVPVYLGVTVKPDVDVTAHFRVTTG